MSVGGWNESSSSAAAAAVADSENVRKVRVGRRINCASSSSNIVGRRAAAGTVFVHQIW